MNQTKSPLKSKTVWASVFISVMTIISAFGIISAEEQSTITDAVMQLVEPVSILAASLLTIYGRIKASTKLSF